VYRQRDDFQVLALTYLRVLLFKPLLFRFEQEDTEETEGLRARLSHARELADNPGGDVLGERECMVSFLDRWFKRISRVTEFCGKWREFDGMV